MMGAEETNILKPFDSATKALGKMQAEKTGTAF